MRQIPLPLGPDPALDFDGFLPGANDAVLTQLRDAPWSASPVYLWGPRGSGKSHLLSAAAHRMQAEGGRVVWAGAQRPVPWLWPDDGDGSALAVIDDCDALDAAQQQAAFALFVKAAGAHQPILAAGTRPPVDLPLRDDLRSRLGWGLVFQIEPLQDEEVRAVLVHEAARRGMALNEDVVRYLQTRFSRDLASLMRLLDRLDRYALARQRGVTVPLLKAMLAEDEPHA
jgi:DnaA family protein